MIGVVICTHRSLAQALLETTEMIVGNFESAQTVAVNPGDGQEAILTRIKAAIDAVNGGSGVMLLCDMFGGTPSNLALSFLSDEVEVVTGVNLPMMLKLFTHREGPLGEVATTIRDHSRENILVAGELLRGKGTKR
jgi:PTS system mannose-specific IIA component